MTKFLWSLTAVFIHSAAFAAVCHVQEESRSAQAVTDIFSNGSARVLGLYGRHIEQGEKLNFESDLSSATTAEEKRSVTQKFLQAPAQKQTLEFYERALARLAEEKSFRWLGVEASRMELNRTREEMQTDFAEMKSNFVKIGLTEAEARKMFLLVHGPAVFRFTTQGGSRLVALESQYLKNVAKSYLTELDVLSAKLKKTLRPALEKPLARFFAKVTEGLQEAVAGPATEAQTIASFMAGLEKLKPQPNAAEQLILREVLQVRLKIAKQTLERDAKVVQRIARYTEEFGPGAFVFGAFHEPSQRRLFLKNCKPVALALPFGKTFDFALLHSYARMDLPKLIQTLQLQTDFLMAKPSQGVYKNLPVASPEILEKARFDIEETWGSFIPVEDTAVGFARDTLILDPELPPSRLIHEAMHADLRRLERLAFGPKVKEDQDLMADYGRLNKKMHFYYNKAMHNDSLMFDPRWRQELFEAAEDCFHLILLAARYTYGEEVMIECACTGLWKNQNRLFTPRRKRSTEFSTPSTAAKKLIFYCAMCFLFWILSPGTQKVTTLLTRRLKMTKPGWPRSQPI